MIKQVLITVGFVLIAAAGFGQQPVHSGIIKAGNLHIYFERTGKGDALLLLHAGLQDHTMWAAQVRALAQRYDVITPDLPFHGKTSGKDSMLVQDVLSVLLDSLHIRKASVAGLSMGASAAQDFIIAYPQRVDKAFLISAGINGYDKMHPVDSLSMDWYYRFEEALKKKDTAQAAVEFTRAWAEGIYRRSDSLKSPASQYVYRTTLATLRKHKMEGWPALNNNPAAIERLTSISVPVMIIDGDKDLPFVTASSQYLAKNIPHARRIVMKNVAHMLNMEKPAELNKLMLEFLNSK